MPRFLTHIIVLMVALLLAVPAATTPSLLWETGQNMKSPRMVLPQAPVKSIAAAASLKIHEDDASPVPEMPSLVVPRTDETFVVISVRPKNAETSLPSSARASPLSA